VINIPTVKEVIEHLKKYPEDLHVAVAIWQEDDVIEFAKENDIKVTRKQAQDIIDRMDRKQDCTMGITWTTIECYLDDLDE